MADDVQTIGTLNCAHLFPFINLFRAFRVAIHPSKLVLGFLLLLFVYCGGRVLDALWPARHYAIADEIDQYESFRWSHDPAHSFDEQRHQLREANAGEYAQRLMQLNLVSDHDAALEAAQKGEYHGKLQSAIVSRRNDEIEHASDDLNRELERIAKIQNLSAEDRAKAELEAHKKSGSSHRRYGSIRRRRPARTSGASTRSRRARFRYVL